MHEAGSVMATVLALLTLGFTADYGGGVRWWNHPGGRLVMATLSATTLVASFVAVRLWVGDFPGHEAVRLVVYGASAAAIAAGWWLHRRLRRQARRERSDHGS